MVKHPVAVVPIVCELWLEIVHKPEKENCTWAFVPKINAEGVQRLCVALNAAHWPTDGALARSDTRAVRWLYSVAVLERISFASDHHVVAIRRHLVALVSGKGRQAWESILWAAYSMKDSELTKSIATLPIYSTTPAPGPHKVATFTLAVRD